MIDNLTISYEDCGVTITLRMPADNRDINRPFALSVMLERVIKDSEFAEEDVLYELCGCFGFEIADNHKTTEQ